MRLRLRSDKSRYPIEKSPLCRIRGIHQFGQVLGVGWRDSSKLLDSRYYKVFWKTSPNKKPRLIQYPIYELAVVHNRLASLLARVEMPDYVFSQKGRSHIDNASEHRGTTPLIKTDIHRFFPSTLHQRIFRFFRDRLECAADIAWRLADLCCYEQKHLPTGSQISGYLAFFSAQEMFDEVAALLVSKDCCPTLFVDDLTVSGKQASTQTLVEMRSIIRHHGYRTSDEKSKTYAATGAKEVTGAVLLRERLLLPNARHKELHQALKSFDHASISDQQILLPRILGRQSEAEQVFARDLA